MSDDATIKEILDGLRPEEICPICNQKFTNVGEHIIEAHAGTLNIGFVKWLMRMHSDLEKIKKIEEGRGVTI
jgi:hypothetical protein